MKSFSLLLVCLVLTKAELHSFLEAGNDELQQANQEIIDAAKAVKSASEKFVSELEDFLDAMDGEAPEMDDETPGKDDEIPSIPQYYQELAPPSDCAIYNVDLNVPHDELTCEDFAGNLPVKYVLRKQEDVDYKFIIYNVPTSMTHVGFYFKSIKPWREDPFQNMNIWTTNKGINSQDLTPCVNEGLADWGGENESGWIICPYELEDGAQFHSFWVDFKETNERLRIEMNIKFLKVK